MEETYSQGQGMTTSDLSEFMRERGYEWSNEAQIYYNGHAASYVHMIRAEAEKLYQEQDSSPKEDVE